MEMKTRGRRIAVMALTVVIAAVLIAGSAGAADKKTTIQLRLDQNINGVPIIKVQPRDFWEIRYDPSKGGGTADYFGDVDIECGKNEIKVQPDKKPDFPNAEWPYSITVYACADGVKAQKIASVDPRIIWND